MTVGALRGGWNHSNRKKHDQNPEGKNKLSRAFPWGSMKERKIMNRQNKSGFTLVEIMLVVIILGVLAAMVIPNLAGKGEQARLTAVKADIEANLSTALDLYEQDNGRFPTTEQGLMALVQKPSSTPEPTN